ncbi:coenzyme F430 synthase [Methanobacterium formicicum]|uniref:Mur ligase middle domain-containing protein n=1 Tax=Methanobacterium formicicum (strain DSM 3637 / PP1) TaxID=1204725 RepID=K2R1G6_METFP|nr:coenzyme F430 synthase [Methanobacterium formicicum]EKF86338.1 Mur ligase middle domain-containing protein [Methanobacterium formicicum DSM 3637]
MRILVVDMTHGGTILASEFSKRKDCKVFAWDIYQTLSEEDKSLLEAQGIELVGESFYESYFHENIVLENDMSRSSLKNDKSNLMVVAPVHCNLPQPPHMTHHQAVGFLLKDQINVPVIEITGVKGKTSTTAMLKEIYRDENPLILSSLGVKVVEDGQEITLQKDISITPASIITAWQLSQKFYKNKVHNVGICIFESSLGGTGLADVGVITNIAEDYSIARGSSSASKAKLQMFKSKVTVCDNESYQKTYSHHYSLNHKPNTFSIDGIGDNVNVKAHIINYGLHKTVFQVKVIDLITINGTSINTSFEVSTFAPAQHHLENTLSAITASLSMGTPIESISNGLKNFTGLPGRTSLSKVGDMVIIEEINPGINVTAVKKAVNMIKGYEKPVLIVGGSYGVTCEEIDETSLSNFLADQSDEVFMILTGDLGLSLWKQMEKQYNYCNSIELALNKSKKVGAKNILLIYRSNFSELGRR